MLPIVILRQTVEILLPAQLSERPDLLSIILLFFVFFVSSRWSCDLAVFPLPDLKMHGITQIERLTLIRG